MLEQPSYTAVLTHILSLFTIAGAAFVSLLFVAVAYLAYTKKLTKYASYLGSYIFPVGLLASFFGMFLTLFYSQVLGFPPCDLCWYQRIFLFPQVFIFAYAWYRKDRSILPYILLLSLVGLLIAIYHHMLQIGFDIMKPCSTAPFAVDCAKPSFIEFGFVTFPFMAVVLFGFLSVVTFVALYFKRKGE